MSTSSTQRVEFYGGPLDGYQQIMTLLPGPFLGVVTQLGQALMSTREGFSAELNPALAGAQPATVPIGVYELQTDANHRPRYQYVRSCTFSIDDLRNGRGLSIEDLRNASA